MDLSLYGVILAAIFSALQFIHQGGDGSGGLKVEARIHLHHTVALCASISLISLTSCKPLPPKISHQISLLFAVLAGAFLLSAAVPENLWWLPHLSSVRLLFEILRGIYHFCIDLYEGILACKQLAREIRQRFVLVNLNPPSSTPVNLSSVLNQV